MRRGFILLIAMMLVLAACGDDSAEPSGPGDVDCTEPPQSELQPESDFEIRVEPNPVEAGSTAMLSVDYEEADGSEITGVGATWECWDGDGWVQTHVIARAFNDFDAATYDLSTEGTVALPDIGLVVPNTHEIVIPDVAAGVYRISDIVYGDGDQLNGHVIVEVTG